MGGIRTADPLIERRESEPLHHDASTSCRDVVSDPVCNALYSILTRITRVAAYFNQSVFHRLIPNSEPFVRSKDGPALALESRNLKPEFVHPL